MKVPFNLKEKLSEAAEHVYDVVKNEQYTVAMKKTGMKIKKSRNTKDTIKWRAKNH